LISSKNQKNLLLRKKGRKGHCQIARTEGTIPFKNSSGALKKPNVRKSWARESKRMGRKVPPDCDKVQVFGSYQKIKKGTAVQEQIELVHPQTGLKCEPLFGHGCEDT